MRIETTSVLLAIVLASACDEDAQSKCPPRNPCGSHGPDLCGSYRFDRSTSPPAHVPAYAYEPDDVRERALGTWEGRFEGSRFEKPFSFTLKVSAAAPDDQDRLGFALASVVDGGGADAGDDAGEADASTRDAGPLANSICTYTRAAAKIELDADVDAFDLHGTALRVRGLQLSSALLDQSSIESGNGLDGQVMTDLIKDGSDYTTTLAFVFGADGKLWLSVFETNEGYEFAEVGKLVDD